MSKAVDHGFLWRISKDGRSSYLYGTLHLANLALMFPGATVTGAVTASDRIALELDLGDAEMMQRLQAAVADDGGAPLPEALAGRVRAAAERACFPSQALSAMSPEMQVMTLASLAGRSDGYYPQYGIDIFMAGFARGLKKPVTSLETAEEQMQALHSDSAEDRIAFVEDVLDTLEDLARLRAQLKRIVDVWANSRFDELQEYKQWCECLKTDEQRALWQRMVDDRNPRLAERIAAIHEGGESVFAAVGSLHMIGDDGLPALLAARGFEVQILPLAR